MGKLPDFKNLVKRQRMDFEGKNVLVTGAAGAIGKGIAAAFAQANAAVFITVDSCGKHKQ